MFAEYKSVSNANIHREITHTNVTNPVASEMVSYLYNSMLLGADAVHFTEGAANYNTGTGVAFGIQATGVKVDPKQLDRLVFQWSLSGRFSGIESIYPVVFTDENPTSVTKPKTAYETFCPDMFTQYEGPNIHTINMNGCCSLSAVPHDPTGNMRFFLGLRFGNVPDTSAVSFEGYVSINVIDRERNPYQPWKN